MPFVAKGKNKRKTPSDLWTSHRFVWWSAFEGTEQLRVLWVRPQCERRDQDRPRDTPVGKCESAERNPSELPAPETIAFLTMRWGRFVLVDLRDEMSVIGFAMKYVMRCDIQCDEMCTIRDRLNAICSQISTKHLISAPFHITQDSEEGTHLEMTERTSGCCPQ